MSVFIWSVNVRTNTELKDSRLCLYMTNLQPEKTNDLPKTRTIFGNISVIQVVFYSALRAILSFNGKKNSGHKD